MPFHRSVENAIGRARRPLGWLWDRGFRFLFLLDAAGLFGSMVVISFVRWRWNWPTYQLTHYWIGFSIATAIHLTVGYFVGLYEREPRLGYRPWLPRIAVATAVSIGFDGLAAVILGRYLMPRGNLAALFIVASLVLVGNRSVSRKLANRRRGPSRVFLVGSGVAAILAERHFDASPSATVVGHVEQVDELLDAVGRSQATDVLLLDLSAFEAAFPEPLTTLDREGVGVHQRVSARETLLGLDAVREIAGMPFTRMRTHAMAAHQLRLKRLFDLATVAVTAPVWLVVLTVLAIYVRIVAGRQVLYRQTRIGFQGSEFAVIKFRTMRRDAEEDGRPQLATADDPRIISALRWMRATRADELPQLWNVLRGEMSLVGPRPERPELIARFEADVAGYARRHELPPGITGFAQINGRYETDPAFKLGYDLQYLVNWSLVLDIQIIVRTAWVVVSRRV